VGGGVRGRQSESVVPVRAGSTQEVQARLAFIAF
jgi:hypothetical protein